MELEVASQVHISRHIPVHIRVHGRDAPCQDDRPDNPTSNPAPPATSGGTVIPETRPQKKTSQGPEKFFVFSLRTQVLREAKAVAARLTDISEQAFAAMTEKTMPIAPEIAEQILVEMARFLIESFDRHRALAPTRSLAVAEEALRQEQAWRASLRQALLCRGRDAVRQPLRDTATRLGIILDKEGPDWLNLAIEATVIPCGAIKTRRERQPSMHTNRRTDPETFDELENGIRPIPPCAPGQTNVRIGPHCVEARAALFWTVPSRILRRASFDGRFLRKSRSSMMLRLNLLASRKSASPRRAPGSLRGRPPEVASRCARRHRLSSAGSGFRWRGRSRRPSPAGCSPCPSNSP